MIFLDIYNGQSNLHQVWWSSWISILAKVVHIKSDDLFGALILIQAPTIISSNLGSSNHHDSNIKIFKPKNFALCFNAIGIWSEARLVSAFCVDIGKMSFHLEERRKWSKCTKDGCSLLLLLVNSQPLRSRFIKFNYEEKSINIKLSCKYCRLPLLSSASLVMLKSPPQQPWSFHGLRAHRRKLYKSLFRKAHR